MKRKQGYYWVNYDLNHGHGWEVAEWRNEQREWKRTDSENEYIDTDFEEIDERRIVRGEAKTININIAKVLSDAGLSSEENKAAIIELLKKSPVVTDEYKKILNNNG